jgi:hypothetical protein
MTIFLPLIGGVAVLGIAASFVAVSRNGYRRQPRPLATNRHSPEAVRDAPTETRPSDLAASQWLREAGPAVGRSPRAHRHAAGAMVLRPW